VREYALILKPSLGATVSRWMERNAFPLIMDNMKKTSKMLFLCGGGNDGPRAVIERVIITPKGVILQKACYPKEKRIRSPGAARKG